MGTAEGAAISNGSQRVFLLEKAVMALVKLPTAADWLRLRGIGERSVGCEKRDGVFGIMPERLKQQTHCCPMGCWYGVVVGWWWLGGGGAGVG